MKGQGRGRGITARATIRRLKAAATAIAFETGPAKLLLLQLGRRGVLVRALTHCGQGRLDRRRGGIQQDSSSRPTDGDGALWWLRGIRLLPDGRHAELFT